MRSRVLASLLPLFMVVAGATAGVPPAGDEAPKAKVTKKAKAAEGRKSKVPKAGEAAATTVTAPVDPMVRRGVKWLVEAQHPNGGWGAGSHARQHVRDPHQVTTDPATTAFVALALLRAGSTPESGPESQAVRRATLHLLETVEKGPKNGPRITDITGTQPQAKLGALVDTAMTAQYLAKLLPRLKSGGDLHTRVDAALARCVRKLEDSQTSDGKWTEGGWAAVLQSSVSTSALEMAQDAGQTVDVKKLEKAREYNKSQFDTVSGRAAPSREAAGVELYAFSSAQRANAAEAQEAQRKIDVAKDEGKLAPEAPVSAENLAKAGVAADQARVLNDAFTANRAQMRRMADEDLLKGFGNNGGEEYLSYLQTSEALVMAGGDEWDSWRSKMTSRLAKIQSNDGSWTGHHCITSPVFCTAAVLQTLTADRDVRSPHVGRAARK